MEVISQPPMSSSVSQHHLPESMAASQQSAASSTSSSLSDLQNESYDSSFASQNTDPEASQETIDSEEGREKHPKARRKRTTAADKKALEEAYLANPKPDKLARLSIVSRVSLNEKEVQIWFQNRRQNDRRKSRPLSQQEIQALRFGTAPGPQDSVSIPVPPQSPTAPSPTPPSAVTGGMSPPRSNARPNPVAETPMRSGHSRTISNDIAVTPQNQPASSHGPSNSFSGSASVGYLANRWNPVGNAPFSTPSAAPFSSSRYASHQTPITNPNNYSIAATPQTFNSAKSHVRLSLSIEGKAELVSNDQEQDSPSTRTSVPSLQRSHSAATNVSLPPFSSFIEAQQPTPPPQSWHPAYSVPRLLHRNRSRDALAWEACAGVDTRDELTALAERESTGSATAAISFIRSASGILEHSITGKRSSFFMENRAAHAKRARLCKSSGNLESIANAATDKLAYDTPSFKSSKVAISSILASPKSSAFCPTSMLVSPTDSDKENWSPSADCNGNNRRRRGHLPAAHIAAQKTPRRALQDATTMRANTAPTPIGARRCVGEKDAVGIYEDSDEVERFMRSQFTTPVKERGDGDLDCVEGLLSLRKGAWR